MVIHNGYHLIFFQVLDPEFRKPFPNVNRWFMTFVNQPQVKAVIGDFSLCTKMAQFDSESARSFHI